MPILEADGLLDPRYAGPLSAMASVYAILAMAMKRLEADGVSVADEEHKDANGKATIRKHPLISVVMAANEKLNAWSKEFGLTPAAMKRLDDEAAPGAKRGGAKLGKFLAR